MPMSREQTDGVLVDIFSRGFEMAEAGKIIAEISVAAEVRGDLEFGAGGPHGGEDEESGEGGWRKGIDTRVSRDKDFPDYVHARKLVTRRRMPVEFAGFVGPAELTWQNVVAAGYMPVCCRELSEVCRLFLGLRR